MNSPGPEFESRISHVAFRAAAAVSGLLRWESPGSQGCRPIAPADLVASIQAPDGWVAVVASELKGAETGSAAILFSRTAVDALLGSLLGSFPGVRFAERERSALCETGNIAISAAAGALGSYVGRPVVPSPPRLDFGRAECVLSRLLVPEAHGRMQLYLAELCWGGGSTSPVAHFVWRVAG